MAPWGKVVGGHFLNATINANQKGDLVLQLGGAAAFKKRPTLTAHSVAAWHEIVSDARGGAAGAVSNLGQAVARAALPGRLGKAASAAVGSAVDSASGGQHTVRVDWVDGNESVIRLPDKLFQHFAIVLKDRQIEPATPPDVAPTPEAPSGVIGQLARLAGAIPQPDVTEQIAKLAALRDQGALTEEEFAAKKTELLGRI